ncbi:MAG TPA: hypothetical protein VK620_01500 [Bradyrhizobium sp.]|jgi:hypothetical protein|nr:hypothetical protein [Bradyrhizobium sp.]
MSSLSDQDHLNPNDQLYYAPRWLRERAEPLPASPAPPEKRSQSVARPNTPPHSFDALLEEAVAESLRHPLDPEVMHEPPGFVRELDRRMAILSVAGRFAAAIGVSAIVALFFVIMVPASRDYAKQPDGDASSVTGILQSVRTALSQPRQRDDELKPALSEFQAILASPSPQAAPAPQPVAREESESSLLQSFVQWQQKPPSPSAP